MFNPGWITPQSDNIGLVADEPSRPRMTSVLATIRPERPGRRLANAWRRCGRGEGWRRGMWCRLSHLRRYKTWAGQPTRPYQRICFGAWLAARLSRCQRKSVDADNSSIRPSADSFPLSSTHSQVESAKVLSDRSTGV